jgi:deoxyribonuclease V
VGVALRSKESKKPIFISVGHKTDLESSVRLVKSLVKKYRTPEPIRLAQLAANQKKDGENIDIETNIGQGSLFN